MTSCLASQVVNDFGQTLWTLCSYLIIKNQVPSPVALSAPYGIWRMCCCQCVFKQICFLQCVFLRVNNSNNAVGDTYIDYWRKWSLLCGQVQEASATIPVGKNSCLRLQYIRTWITAATTHCKNLEDVYHFLNVFSWGIIQWELRRCWWLYLCVVCLRHTYVTQ
jgi:hypothetical protein